jgi:hypothetical protein
VCHWSPLAIVGTTANRARWTLVSINAMRRNT